MELTNQDARRASTPLHAPEIPSSTDGAHDFTEAKRRVFEKNSAGVAMRTPVRLTTARVIMFGVVRQQPIRLARHRGKKYWNIWRMPDQVTV